MDPNGALEIVYPNNNNNNNKLKKKKENQKVIKVKWGGGGRGRTECGRTNWREVFLFIFFLLFVSFLDLWKSDRRFSSEQKKKLVYATRATRRYQKLSISANSKR